MNALEAKARAEHHAALRRWLVVGLAVLGLGAGTVAAGVPSQVAQLLFGIGPVATLDTVPRHLKYSGFLEIGGQPVHTPDAGTLIVARLYAFADAGSSLWSQTQRVPVINGRFTLELGDEADGGARAIPSPPAPTTQRLFIELAVGSPAVNLPRQQLLTVPYALRSGDIISDDRVVTVGGTGADFATLYAALSWLNTKVVRGSVTVRLLDGTHLAPTAFGCDHPDGARIRIIGNLAAPTLVLISTSGWGFSISSSLGQLAGFRLVGPGTVAGNVGIRVGAGSTQIGPAVQIAGYDIGVDVLFGRVTIDDLQVAGRGRVSGSGVSVCSGAQANISRYTATNAQLGLYACGAGTAKVDTATLSGVAIGALASRSSQIEVTGTVVISDANEGYAAHLQSVVRGSPNTTFTMVTTPRAPPLNVVDNFNSYVTE